MELGGIKKERNIVRTIKRRKADYIGHILRTNCLLRHIFKAEIVEGIKATGRRGRGRNQQMDVLQETEIIVEIEIGSAKLHCVES